MAVNYRSAPLTFRGDDPSQWFSQQRPRSRREERRAGSACADAGASAATRRPDDHPDLSRGAAADPADPGLARGAAQLRHPRAALAPGVAQRAVDPGQPADHRHLRGVHARHRPGGRGRVLGPAITSGISPRWTICGWAAGVWSAPCCRARRTWPSCHALPGAAAAAGPALPPRPNVAWGAGRDQVRDFVVTARRHEHEYDGRHLTDPWGLVYATADGWRDEPVEDGADEADPARGGRAPDRRAARAAGPARRVGPGDADQRVAARPARGAAATPSASSRARRACRWNASSTSWVTRRTVRCHPACPCTRACCATTWSATTART